MRRRPLEDDPLLGADVSHYRVVARLGQGGMGVVYRAHDTRLSRNVALKILPPSVAGEQERRTRFLREARSAAAINHPNVATVYEAGESDGRVYMAMELVDGTTLHDRLAQGRLERGEAIRIAVEIARGVACAHDRGIVHRDLKPANVMLTPRGAVKILDFGLAKLRDLPGEGAIEQMDTQTQQGRVMGTPGYMSPEQATGASTDERTDVYALGVVLCEMLLGERPSPYGASLPEGDPLADILRRCLSRAPQDRWANAGALASALDALGDGVRVPRSRAIRVWVAAVAAVVVAAAGVVAWPSSRPPAPRAGGAASASPIPSSTTLADLPLPVSANKEALAEYAAGMQLLRDASWYPAAVRFQRAASLDPTLALAHLRAAIALLGTAHRAEMRASFARARALRDRLGDRDRALLDAFEPMVGRSNPDKGESIALLDRAHGQYPDDEELVADLAILEVGDPARGVPAARRAVELDPLHADAWQSLGDSLAIAGQLDEATRALERCAATSVESSDCLGMLAALAGQAGRCSEMERLALRQADVEPSWGGMLAANAKLALHRSDEAVRETYARAVAADPAYGLTPSHDLDVASAVLHGRFDVVVRLADQALRAVEASETTRAALVPNRDAASLRIQVAMEVGDEAGARAAAAAFVARSGALTTTDASPGLDVSLWIARVAGEHLGGGRLAWKETQLRAASPSALVWVLGWAMPALTLDEAKDAAAALDGDPRLALPRGGEIVRWGGAADAEAGRVLLVAGRRQAALPLLRRAASSCFVLDQPFAAVRSQLDLGRALEQEGDVSGACRAYGIVAAAWGRATPRSVTAEAARRAAAGLRCGP